MDFLQYVDADYDIQIDDDITDVSDYDIQLDDDITDLSDYDIQLNDDFTDFGDYDIKLNDDITVSVDKMTILMSTHHLRYPLSPPLLLGRPSLSY